MAETKYRVLFHLADADPAKHKHVMQNVENTLNDFGPGEVEIEVVANAGGITAFAAEQTTIGAQIAHLAEQGVDLAACANSMRGHQLTPEQLVPNVRIVSSGTGELTRKQAEGWGYIRP